jgi:hypothetical protein
MPPSRFAPFTVGRHAGQGLHDALIGKGDFSDDFNLLYRLQIHR